MKKCLMAAMLAAFTSLAACGGIAVGEETGNADWREQMKRAAGEGEAENSAGTDMRFYSMHSQERETETLEETEIFVFAAASLRTVMDELITEYQRSQPNVRVTVNADGSGRLLAQIEEGFVCDIFFPAGEKQMDVLEEEGFLVEGTRRNLVGNQVIVVTRMGTKTRVSGLFDIGKAESVALADGNVPVGKHTRTALMELGLLERTDYPEDYTSAQIAQALGTTISEQDNVGAVLTAVLEGSCEVGTVYYSDICGCEEELEILEVVGCGLTGDVIYSVARVKNDEANGLSGRAADDFFCFLCSQEAAKIFESYYFDTDVR